MRAFRLLEQVLWREPGESETVLWAFVVNGLIASHIWPSRVRTQLYRLMGIDLHPKVFIRPGATFRSRNVSVGPGTYIGWGAFFDVRSKLTIGGNCGIGSQTVFADSDHEMNDPARRAGAGFRVPISVGDGARVSTRSLVLRGVTVGAGAVVGAGSVVTSDCIPHGLYVGSPAKLLRELPQ